eukprot:7296229-Prymnesium_polylepis.1
MVEAVHEILDVALQALPCALLPRIVVHSGRVALGSLGARAALVGQVARQVSAALLVAVRHALRICATAGVPEAHAFRPGIKVGVFRVAWLARRAAAALVRQVARE